MKLGIIGLGRMGGNMRTRLRQGGHEAVGYDPNQQVSDFPSLEAMVAALPSPKVVWSMVPSGAITDKTIDELAGVLTRGDIVIDGGNSYFRDSIRHGEVLSAKGIHFLDIGTSGGVWGLEEGYCLMAGGPREAFDHVEPILATLAPKDGYAYVGPSGAGQFSKMVHNGIEYGMLQAYAEGFELLHAADEFHYDLHQLAKLWNQGSVVRSWLLELAEDAFEKDPGLDKLEGYVDDSGEGRWTILEAVQRGVPATVLAHSLFARFTSRQDNSFGMRVIAALRNEFGGHPVKNA
ncbi:decarboxylating 6-phosphogluconate dehydrogenase [bacterium]|nr:decarboxylating 6-phosphogluconate dehydrogenase [bacterium]